MTSSVCIPTYRRANELARCLDALASQVTPPDEIVVADAADDAETRTLLESYRDRRPWTIRHCPTQRRGLPQQRWWAFQHSTGSIVVFLDDDVRLTPPALGRLLETYERLPDIAGAGFAIAFDGCDARTRLSSPLRERWLGISGARPGSITAGGITINLALVEDSARVQEVEWLWGGAMSYRRDVLDATAPLDRLFDLYDRHIGISEDALLSSRVRRQGRLVMIPGIYARHPAWAQATRTESPQDGFHKGVLETWGRAHVLRWLARDSTTAYRAWLRVASLELARAVRGVLRRPVASARWLRIAGGLVGIGRTLRGWGRIPPHPQSS